MSYSYSVSIATGLVITKNDLTALSFLPAAVGKDSQVFFDPDATVSECFYIVRKHLADVLGNDIAVSMSYDQWGGSFEETMVVYAPSTHRDLDMKYGNVYRAFQVNAGPVMSSDEHKVLATFADEIGIGSDNIGPVVWGSIL